MQAKVKLQVKELLVYYDSMLMVNQVKSDYAVHHLAMGPYPKLYLKVSASAKFSKSLETRMYMMTP